MRTIIARAATATATAMLRAHRARRTAGILHVLSDAQLKDIGVTRFDIGRAAKASRRPLAD